MNGGDLGAGARAVVTGARSAHDPPPDARKRVRARIDAAIAGAATGPSASAPTSAGARWGALARGAIVLASAVVVTAIVWRAGSRSPVSPGGGASAVVVSPPVAMPVGAAAGEAPPPSVEEVSSARPVAPTAPLPLTPRAPLPPPSSAAGSVAIEAALVRRAEGALRAGDPKGALAIVGEHARRFPTGVLTEERDMERIVALCALGRRDEATTAAAVFTRTWPSSSHAARIREACDNGGPP